MLEARCLFAIGLYVVIVGLCSGYDYFSDDKRQDLVPFPRVGRSEGEWKDREKPKGLIPFPRIGKRQELIPFPRIGRSFYDPEDYSEDVDQYESMYFLLPYNKRLGMLRPRIGRKKRSVESQSEDDSNQEEWADGDYERTKCPSVLNFNKRISECVESIANRPSRSYSMQPRIGRRNPGIKSEGPRIGRSHFSPRVGRSDNNGFQ